MKTTVIVLLLLGPMHLLAWGPTGHRAIGVVAHEHLSAKARKKVLSILEGQSLAMAGTWMDEATLEPAIAAAMQARLAELLGVAPGDVVVRGEAAQRLSDGARVDASAPAPAAAVASNEATP